MASPIVVLLLICYLYLLFGCRGCVYLPFNHCGVLIGTRHFVMPMIVRRFLCAAVF